MFPNWDIKQRNLCVSLCEKLRVVSVLRCVIGEAACGECAEVLVYVRSCVW